VTFGYQTTRFIRHAVLVEGDDYKHTTLHALRDLTPKKRNEAQKQTQVTNFL
jgi:hypothetical protein